jgi:uncharacterized protein
MTMMDLDSKYDALTTHLKALQKVVIAYSGGVDSTFLLKAAVDTLGKDSVLAILGVSASLARSQYAQAMDLARGIGATVIEVPLDELADGRYAANLADRCFHCKSHLYARLAEVGREHGFGHVVCGTNFDDQDDYRPGNRAAEAAGVESPLMQAQLTKADIRQLSRRMGLSSADRPSSPCLASRIAYGLPVTEERLGQVEQAEDFLRSLGLKEFRVRHHDLVARIEVRPDDLAQVIAPEARVRIVERLKALGFKYVTVDLQGFRSGSLNETLSEEEKRSKNQEVRSKKQEVRSKKQEVRNRK